MKAETKKNNAARSNVADAAEDGNIDKIRDILFGSQARDFDRRFARLEEHFTKEVSDMRDETRRKLDALEDYVKSEIKSLAERLANEQSSRVDAVKELSGELQTLAHNFDKKVTKMNEQAAKSESDLRQQILSQSKNLSDDIQKRYNDLLASLERESSEIRDDKADRAALAELFTEMALRLTNDFNLPKTD
jgi:DNA anti-recombination protein RmuC